MIPRLRKSQTEILKVFEPEVLWPGLPSRESSYNTERRKEGILQGSPLETAFGASEPLNSKFEIELLSPSKGKGAQKKRI